MRLDTMQRAALVEAVTGGADVAEVAAAFGVSPPTVRRWVARSRDGGPLADAPRAGRSAERAEIRALVMAELVRAGSGLLGPGYSTRALAHRIGASQSAVSRAMRDLDPCRVPVSAVPGRAVLAPTTAPAASSVLQGAGKNNGGSGATALVGVSVRGPRVALAFEPLAEAPDSAAHLARMRSGLGAVLLHRGAPWVEVVAWAGELGRCGHIPAALFNSVARGSRSTRGVFVWRADSVEPASAAPTTSGVAISDSEGVAGQPRTQVLVRALEREIRDAGLEAGDLIGRSRLRSLTGLGRAELAAAITELGAESIVRETAAGVRLPAVTSAEVLDLYAARRELGAVLLRALAAGLHTGSRSVAEQGRSLAVLEAELGRVRHLALSRPDHVAGADLAFQSACARAAGLGHTGAAFAAISLRLHVFIAILKMNYAAAAARIAYDDTRILTALRAGDPAAAVAAWRAKIDNAVRHMSGTAQARRFDAGRWEELLGD
ncbi:helix-turn-helix domain-containing protein [Brevibacterium sp. 50QC2O2]|uniref:helix-turn-helix domain-containing protein n=1 Tax=Brevibacterium TaxID=1696 RepID=UPI00211B811A|nr:helix-turn-helix domain-containing protein [Brevibacterium sp. 68QC2CO]MCQ9387604.1 helix-turn-helix domain-containing protein [Brevibacterium sp. 50QC2O2]